MVCKIVQSIFLSYIWRFSFIQRSVNSIEISPCPLELCGQFPRFSFIIPILEERVKLQCYFWGVPVSVLIVRELQRPAALVDTSSGLTCTRVVTGQGLVSGAGASPATDLNHPSLHRPARHAHPDVTKRWRRGVRKRGPMFCSCAARTEQHQDLWGWNDFIINI